VFSTYASVKIILGGIFLSTFGQRLKDLRRAAHLTQAQLAKYLDMTRENISLYEHDKNKTIPDPVIKKLSNLFNVPPSYLRLEQDIPFEDLLKLVPAEKLESYDFIDGKWKVKTSLSGKEIETDNNDKDGEKKKADLSDMMQDKSTIMAWQGRPIPPEELEMIRRILDGGK
jgi:transcriptional regulator with XRE-family HTH domain